MTIGTICKLNYYVNINSWLHGCIVEVVGKDKNRLKIKFLKNKQGLELNVPMLKIPKEYLIPLDLLKLKML